MELLACGFGKPLGFTEKQVVGPLLTHKTIPNHEYKSFKHPLRNMSTYAQQSSTRRPPDHDDKTWKRPGEFGRVQARLKRTKRDLKMEREVHGQSPSVIFLDRAEMHIDIPAIPAPAGMPAPTPNTGEAYIRQSDGTPKLKRSLNFTPSIESDAGRESITTVRSTNPKYVTDQVWEELHVWVHNWILQRIPEEHQHLVEGVKEGDIKDLLDKVFGSDSQHAIPSSTARLWL